MLVHKGKDFENMSPTSDALYQHRLRSVHQSGNNWSHIHEPSYKEKDFAEWGLRVLREKVLREKHNQFTPLNPLFLEHCQIWICVGVKPDAAKCVNAKPNVNNNNDRNNDDNNSNNNNNNNNKNEINSNNNNSSRTVYQARSSTLPIHIVIGYTSVIYIVIANKKLLRYKSSNYPRLIKS